MSCRLFTLPRDLTDPPMANYLSLEDAAKQLGIPTDKLVELRSSGSVRGFRDGASWKFPDTEIERLKDELPDLLGSSGILGGGLMGSPDNQDSSLSIDDSELDLAVGDLSKSDPGSSDLGIGGDLNLESVASTGSDVNLVPSSDSDGSDVSIVPGDSELLLESGGSDLLELDSGQISLNDPAILHDSAQLDLAIEPNAGSTGPVTDQELKEISESHPDVLSPDPNDAKGSTGPGSSGGSVLDLAASDLESAGSGDLSFTGSNDDDDDSGEDIIGDDESAMDVIGSDINLAADLDVADATNQASSLELMGDLGTSSAGEDALTGASRGVDVLSELDLLSAEQQGSDLISGDSEGLLGSSGLGSSLASDALADSAMSGIDDALADDDDLVIADDDDDLVISSAGSDISVAGDSGINLMSPSDSGLSLESEPLDLAGSSISALDLGAELSEGGSSGSGVGPAEGSGSLVDFQADEEFQLSPSGIGLDADIESASQVIEIEDSGEAVAEVAEAVDLGGDVFGEPVPDDGAMAEGGFAADGGQGDDGGFGGAEAVAAVALDGESEETVVVDPTASVAASGVAPISSYEVPFTLLQCVTLMLILLALGLGGILMTDLVRNMWTYTEPSPPVSSLTNWLIDSVGFGP